MEDERIGRIVRALRRRRGWRQCDLAAAAGCGQPTISLLERGQLENVSLTTLRRVVSKLEANLNLEIRWRGTALDRLLDEEHAALVARVVAALERLGWQTRIEVTYSEFGERGSYDILAWHAPTRTLLVIEVKTDLPSAEATVRKLDEKTRLARKVAREQLGWDAVLVGRVLVMPETSTLRRRVDRHRTYFSNSVPRCGRDINSWLRAPSGRMSGLWFLSDSGVAVGIKKRGGRERVRVRKSAGAAAESLPDNDVIAV